MLTSGDGDNLAATFADRDLVVFDSLRMILTDMGLKESDPDDYADFMGAIIDPLFRVGTATMVLDNTGHTEKERPRNTAAKIDLNDIVFALKTVQPFNINKQGRQALWPTAGRIGGLAEEFTLDIGGGVYGPWHPRTRDDFLAAVLAVLKADGGTMGADRLMDAARKT